MDEILNKREKLRSRYIKYKPPLDSSSNIKSTPSPVEMKEISFQSNNQNQNHSQFDCCGYLFKKCMNLINN